MNIKKEMNKEFNKIDNDPVDLYQFLFITKLMNKDKTEEECKAIAQVKADEHNKKFGLI